MSLLKQNDNDTQTMIDELKVEVDSDRISKCGHLLKKKPPRPINLFEADLAYYTVKIKDMMFTIRKSHCNRPNITYKYDLEGIYDNFINAVKEARIQYRQDKRTEYLCVKFGDRGISDSNIDNNCFGNGFGNNGGIDSSNSKNVKVDWYSIINMNIEKREFFSNLEIHYKMIPTGSSNGFGNGKIKINVHREFKTKLIEQQLYNFEEQWNYYIECLASQYKPEILYQNRHIKFNEAKRAQWIYDACHGKKPEVIEILDDNEETPKIVQETVVDQKIRREKFLNDSYKFSKSPLFSQKIFN